MCALSGCALHLIHPLGFEISDAKLRRAGMDYWHALDVRHHENWAAFTTAKDAPKRHWLLTTKASRTIWDVSFKDGDALVFGSESSGVPIEVRESIPEAYHIKIPQLVSEDKLPTVIREEMRAARIGAPGKPRVVGDQREILRSFNLSTACGIAAYEALRQLHRR